MKNTKEVLSKPFYAALCILLPILAVGGALTAFIYLCSEDPEMFSGAPHFWSILTGVVFLIATAFGIACYIVVVLRLITKHEVIDWTEGNFATMYEIVGQPTFLNFTSAVSGNDAIVRYWLEVNLSRTQVAMIYNLMHRKNTIVYTLPAFNLPEPLGTVRLKMTQRFVKRLLKEMREDEFVILQWETSRDYIAFDKPLHQAVYVSLLDLGRIEPLLQTSPELAIRTYNRNCHIFVTAERIADWRQQLEASGHKYLRINTID